MEWHYSEDRKRIVLNTLPKRHKKITGHRFPSVLGLNKYQSQFGAWCEITGLVKLPFEDNKYTLAGKAIEPKQIEYAKQMFPNILSIEEYYGNAINDYRYTNFKDLNRIFDGVRDFVSVKNDGKTIAMVGECKTSSKPQDWEGNNVPIDYLCQGMLYAYLDKLDKIVYVTSFLQPMDYNNPENYVVNNTNTKFTVKKLNECFLEVPEKGYCDINGAIDYCEEWWQKYVETGVSPEFDEKLDKEYLDIIRASQPANDNSLEDLCVSGISLARQIKELEETSGLNNLKKELKVIETAIKNVMTDKNLDTCGKYKLKRTSKIVFNEKQFAKDNEKLYNNYCEETVSYTLSKDTKEED